MYRRQERGLYKADIEPAKGAIERSRWESAALTDFRPVLIISGAPGAGRPNLIETAPLLDLIESCPIRRPNFLINLRF
jgi:hypothetical protein